MAAPPPAHLAAVAQPRTKRRTLGGLFGWVGTKGCMHALKLRHNYKLDSRTRLEVGLDFPIVDNQRLPHMWKTAAPWAALWYQLDANDTTKGSLELNPTWAAINKQLTIGREGTWWEVPVGAKLGATYAGKPFVQLAIGNLPLALGLAAALLASGKTISLERKEVGGLAVKFSSGSYCLQERLEFDATLRREGGGLKLDFSQLNGVLRAKQE